MIRGKCRSMKCVSVAVCWLFLLFGSACKSEESKSESKPAPKAEPATVEPAPIGAEAAHAKTAKPDESGIAWIENDYAAAVKLATEQGKPLLIDLWADWCHTCLAMKAGVLRDRGLAKVADNFVWLSVDTEDPASAEAMKAFPPKVWPTFLVVSPGDGSVQATQVGSCSVSAFRDFAERGGRGHLAALEAGGRLKKGSPLAHLRAADRAWMNDSYKEAAKHYGAARKAGGEGWAGAQAALKNQISALHHLEDKKPCAKLANAELTFMTEQHDSSGTDFMYYASDCAKALDEAGTKALREQSIAALRTILNDKEAALSYDDRSDALATSRGIADDLGLQDLASSIGVRQRTLLAKAVAEAGSALEEMTYVWHQVEVHEYLGKGHSILAWVESLEARLPNEYDPPYRRAWLLSKLKRYEEAHEAIAIALPLAHGGRRGRILGLQADVYKAESNVAKEREAREAVIAYYEGLAEGMIPAKRLEDAKESLAKMDEKKSEP